MATVTTRIQHGAPRDFGSRSISLSTIESTTSGHGRHEEEGSEIVERTPLATETLSLMPVSRKRQISTMLSAFFTMFLTVGLNQTYGVFQTAYLSPETTILAPESKPSVGLVAFVGTLGYGLTWGGSIIVNPWMARTRDFRYITGTGSFLMSLGLGLASLSTQTFHLLLTQGFLYGLGASFLYFPILSVAPEYFAERRGLAMGIILSAAGIGAAILSPVVRTLIAATGVRWTLRILAFCYFLLSSAIAWTTPPSRFAARRVTHVSLAIAKKPTFLLSVFAALFQSSGNLIPSTFLSDFSVALGYSVGLAAALISISNGVNAFSRIVTGFAGDRLGRQNALVVTVIGSAVAVIALWLASIESENRGIWIAFVVVYGVWAGGYNALYPTTVADVFGIQAYASVNGFIYFIRGLGSLFGSPVAGVLLGANDESAAGLKKYRKVVYLDAALLFAASLCIIGVRYFDAREKGTFKLRA